MKLNRKEIKIFPTQHGFLFIAILLAMLLGSINYNNNAGFILVFLLGGMGLISILHSFKNLKGLGVDFLTPLPVFAGQTCVFPLLITPPSTGCRSLNFSLSAPDPGPASTHIDSNHIGSIVMVSTDKTITLQIRVIAKDRGILQPKHLIIESLYPFGLFTFSALLPVKAGCTIYPRPVSGPFTSKARGHLPRGEEKRSRQGIDDFQGLKQYQPGHSINRVSWKALSRGRGLFIKDFTAEDSPCVILDFDAIPGKEVEFKLSRLCDLILTAHRQQMEYGLSLPGFVKGPARGDAHKHNCLKALSGFNIHGSHFQKRFKETAP